MNRSEINVQLCRWTLDDGSVCLAFQDEEGQYVVSYKFSGPINLCRVLRVAGLPPKLAFRKELSPEIRLSYSQQQMLGLRRI